MQNHNFSRRHFLSLLGIAFPALYGVTSLTLASKLAATNRKATVINDPKKPTVGIALGAGGANGLAHILMLEVLDELGIKPYRIAGSSIGSIIGALYASGMSGKQIRGLVEQFIISPDEELTEELVNKQALRWIEFIEIELGNGGLLSSEGFITFIYDKLKKVDFLELDIPLKIVAADLWERQQVVLESGELLPAIKSSMALPGVFEPVLLNDRLLIDGGTVNPVPYDLLMEECDFVIAIDVNGKRSKPEDLKASYFETIFNSAKVMQQAIMTEKLRHNKPAIYLAPQIVDIRALEFYRAREVFKQAEPAKQELRKQLTALLKV
jgi:NTE family protein